MKTQDDIFRAMSADRKMKVGSMLWRLAKELAPDKITFKPGSKASYKAQKREMEKFLKGFTKWTIF